MLTLEPELQTLLFSTQSEVYCFRFWRYVVTERSQRLFLNPPHAGCQLCWQSPKIKGSCTAFCCCQGGKRTKDSVLESVVCGLR